MNEREAPVLKSFTASSKDDRCLEVWFANEVTEDTRAWLLEAINEKALRGVAQPPMQADIAQIIDHGWRNGKSSAEGAEEILREFDARAQSLWRDIDNAPRDGRWILTLSWPYSNIPTALHWDGNRWWDDSTEVPAGNTICEWQPSHWMPLLDGPSLSSTESKPGFFANLTPEQQKSALEYDGPENHGDAALIPTDREGK